MQLPAASDDRTGSGLPTPRAASGIQMHAAEIADPHLCPATDAMEAAMEAD